jgi:hypothetical protein
MTLADLTHGQRVRYRVGRAGETAVTWGPWTTGTLHVQRSLYPERGRRKPSLPPPGRLAVLTIREDVVAEYVERDYCGQGVFNVEDWYLEIEGLV